MVTNLRSTYSINCLIPKQ